MSFNSFGKEFELQRVKSWDKYYIDYDGQITNINKLIDFLKKITKENKKLEIPDSFQKENDNKKEIQEQNISSENLSSQNQPSMSKKSFGGQETLLSMLRENSINNKERNTSISEEKELQKIGKKEEKKENKNKEKEKEEEKNKKKEKETDIFNEDNNDPKHKKQNEIIEKINEFFESLDKEIKKYIYFFLLMKKVYIKILAKNSKINKI